MKNTKRIVSVKGTQHITYYYMYWFTEILMHKQCLQMYFELLFR